jgi:uncharacterized protein YqgC (DUF456 family)
MDTTFLLWVTAVVAVGLGHASVVLPLLSGTPLLFGGLWWAPWRGSYSRVSVLTVGVLSLMAMALLLWLADYAAAALGVRRAGASTTAAAEVDQGQGRGGRAYTRRIWRNAGGPPVAGHWKVHGAGHAWSC